MTFDELYKAVLEILPNATIGEDSEGDLIIYTGLNPYTLCPHCGETHHEDETHECKD